MDEKDLIKRIKNSFKEGMSRSEITRRMQKKGCKLEYIDLLIKKASKIRRILFFSSVILILILALTITSYALIFKEKKAEIENPSQNWKIISGKDSSQQADGNTVRIEDIEITPDFISYLLNEIGALQLHKNPFTFEKPIINFNISGMQFFSIINKEIKTSNGSSEKADLEFITAREEIIYALLNPNPKDYFKESIQKGNTQINILASKPELFAKGYLSLYNSLENS